jgi:hypothetical protein
MMVVVRRRDRQGAERLQYRFMGAATGGYAHAKLTPESPIVAYSASEA